jgi:hypothetical protein
MFLKQNREKHRCWQNTPCQDSLCFMAFIVLVDPFHTTPGGGEKGEKREKKKEKGEGEGKKKRILN